LSIAAIDQFGKRLGCFDGAVMHLPRRLAASWGPGRNYTGFLPVLALNPHEIHA